MADAARDAGQTGNRDMIEIERKFLVADTRWRDEADSGTLVLQGYIAISNGNSVRVRIKGDGSAWLTVKAGTTVTFMNEDGAPHTATGDGWDTGRLNRGDSKDVTFDTAGTFAYVCAIHPSMKGTITVE